MDAKTLLQERHDKAKRKLMIIAEKKVFMYGLIKCSTEIAEKFGVSSQTIINYINGKCSDGYFTEALIKEFKALHIQSN